MKGTITIAVFLLLSCVSFGQLARGNWMVGGNVNIVTESYTKAIIGDKYKTTTFQFSPGVGYFVLSKVPIGLKIQVENIHTTIQSAAGTSASNSTNILAGPFARYYFLEETSKRINLFIEGNYEIGFVKYLGSSKNPIRQIDLSAGSVIFFNSSVGLEFTIGYRNNDTEGQSQKTGLRAGIGFQIHLSND